MTSAPGLSVAAGRQWARRVPSTVVIIGPLLLGVLFLAATWNDPAGLTGDVGQVTSWHELLIGVPLGVGIGTIIFGWLLPRVGAWVMVVVAPLTLLDVDGTGAPPSWLIAVTMAWVGLVVIDFLLLLRQRRHAAALQPRVPGAGEWRAERHRAARWVSSVLLVLGVIAGVLLWMQWRSDLLTFEARALPVQAKVTQIDTFFDTVVVDLHGEDREFMVNDAEDHPVGTALTVLTDPTGEIKPFTSEDADPQGWSQIGIPIGAAVLLLALVGYEFGRRRRRAEHLANHGGPTMNVMLRGPNAFRRWGTRWPTRLPSSATLIGAATFCFWAQPWRLWPG